VATRTTIFFTEIPPCDLTSAAAAMGGGAHPLRSGFFSLVVKTLRAQPEALPSLSGSCCPTAPLFRPGAGQADTNHTGHTSFTTHAGPAQLILSPFGPHEQVLSTHDASTTSAGRAYRGHAVKYDHRTRSTLRVQCRGRSTALRGRRASFEMWVTAAIAASWRMKPRCAHAHRGRVDPRSFDLFSLVSDDLYEPV
jgi:hypothetical protein